ncbi:MAG: biotin--[Ruminococcus sp.]|nr:biotin--[acetyl-CoA-carboxylase] ligase [Ruminococcus sp.]
MAIKSKKIEKFLKKSVSVRVYDAIDSTNNEAKRRLETDRGEITLYVTDCQTAGRGRRGHDFYSPKGSGLYFTLALPLSAEPADVQVITCAAAVAACEGIEAVSGRHPQIKWVNDVLIGGKKVAGILTELVTDGQNQPASVIIGIGINLTTAHFPAEFAAKAGSVGKVDPNRLCAEVVNRLIWMYNAINYSDLELKNSNNSLIESNYSFNSILEKYKQLNLCIGITVQYTDNDGVHTATAVDIAPDGSRVVEDSGIRKQLHSGEISITPTA